MTVLYVGVMVWEQLGLPKSQGRQCRQERAWPGKDSAWKHKQSSRLLFWRRCCWTASLPLSHLINNNLNSDPSWAITQWHSCSSLSGQPCPLMAGNGLTSPTADPQDSTAEEPGYSASQNCCSVVKIECSCQHYSISMFPFSTGKRRWEI